jgi:hypothetical protein
MTPDPLPEIAYASLEREWIFTFGYDHVDPISGEPLRNCFVAITGTAESTRAVMLERFGQKWSNQYPTREAAGVKRYNLIRLVIDSPYSAAELE